MDRELRLEELRPFVAAARQMQGWSFTYTPVSLGPPQPWDYEGRARELAQGAARILDMGTGGGEVYERILDGYQGCAVATESWPPNVPAAARRLKPLGGAVVHCNNMVLPFGAAFFDLVLDHHEALSPADVARVLKPGGHVLTQQVHPAYHAELREFFPRMTVFEQHHVTYPSGFTAAGLTVLNMRQHNDLAAYRQLGHLVYVLVVAPWTIPDFDLDSDLEALLEVERRLGGPDGIVLSAPRYLLEARKPA